MWYLKLRLEEITKEGCSEDQDQGLSMLQGCDVWEKGRSLQRGFWERIPGKPKESREWNVWRETRGKSIKNQIETVSVTFLLL